MSDTPKNVRNFFLRGKVDGVTTEIATGPQGKDGGFELTILMRENGKISDEKVQIQGYVEDGKVFVRAFPSSQVQMGFEIGVTR